MTRWLLAVSLLCLGATTGLAAQQNARSAQVSSVASPAGPRIESAWPRYEASLPAAPGQAAYLASASLNDRHTLVFSTIGLIIIAVLVVLVLM